MTLPLYVADDEAARAETTLAAAGDGPSRTAALVALAWHLRERDGRRALDLTAEGLRRDPAPAERARLHLVEAHALALLDEAAAAAAALAAARHALAGLDDPVLEGDAAVTEAMLALQDGSKRAEVAAYRTAAGHYRRAGDAARTRLAEAWTAWAESYIDARKAQADWAAALPADGAFEDPALRAVVLAFHAFVTVQRGDFRGSIALSVPALDLAAGCGLLRLAVIGANNVGVMILNLNDMGAALPWFERALEIGRRAAWPQCTAAALNGMGVAHKLLRRHDLADAALDEALALLERAPRSRQVAIAHRYKGEVLLERGQAAVALPWLRESLARAQALEAVDLAGAALRRIGEAEAQLGHADAAWAAVQEALALARRTGNRFDEGNTLTALAGLYRQFDLPPGPAGSRLEAERAILEEALALFEGIEGAIPDPEVLDRLTAIHEARDDPRAALALAKRAAAARLARQSREATDRQAVLQVRLDTERAQEQARHHQDLAGLLDRLVAIGRELTALLEPQAVAAALHRHVQALLPADALSLYRREADGRMTGRRLDGGAAPAVAAGPGDPAVQCLAERAELLIDRGDGAAGPGGRTLRTALYAPLLAGDRLVGALAVEADRPLAYGARERLVFRTLCGYAAIALANADAFREAEAARAAAADALETLRAAQAQLVQQEKLASLGALVAGVAHEINTPLGIALTAATQLDGERRQLAGDYEARRMNREVMEGYLARAGQGTGILLANLARAAELVRSFKRVAADRTAGGRQTVDAGAYLADVAQSLRPLLAGSRIRLVLNLPPGVRLTTEPGALAQAVTNLVQNAVLHAFAADAGAPEIRIGLTEEGGRVAVAVADNGAGMPEAVRARAFDPFFTTRRGSGGTGLGLHIVHNLVTGPLGGTVSLDTAPGSGTRVTLTLPAGGPG
ncbi:MAG TPA: ATP-binding protein [Azospirillaceae bacterium]|nr:ATP-binding protein [Azospirillaceae bacterium]